MIALHYRIVLLEPLLVTRLEGEPNSKISMRYLPGSALRGAVMAAYAAETGVEDLAADPNAAELFIKDGVRFLNGYPVAAEQPAQRCLPTPRSWRIEKGVEIADGVFDFAAEEYATTLPDDEWNDKAQWKPVGSPFRTPRERPDDMVYLIDPPLQVNIHTTRNRRMGRATEEDGQVFRYQALAAGQIYAAVALCIDEAQAAEITKRLPCIRALGGARNAGYGRVEVLADSIYYESSSRESSSAGWREYDLEAPELDATRLTVTLLSDALLRDEAGQPCALLDAVEAAIRRVIPGATLAAEMANGTPQKRAFQEVSISGGFNRTWGLPLAQAPACSAGSVYVFHVADWTLEQVAALERDGIGERRNEGYGRVGVTALTVPQISCMKGNTLRREAVAALAPANQQMAHHMADRLLQQRLERLILTRAANYPIRMCPSGSQIARLRAVLLEQLLKPRGTMSVAPVVAFVNGLRSHAETQYRKARVQGRPLRPLNEWIRWLCANATTSEFTVQTLGFNRTDGVTLGGVRSTLLTENGDLTQEAATECALMFLDAVLARAAKEKNVE